MRVAAQVDVTRRAVDDVPAWLMIEDMTDLASRASRWSRRPGVVPVIIDQPLDAANIDHVLEALEVLAFQEARWWTLDEVQAADVGFLPPRLPELLPQLITGPLPDPPLDISPATDAG